MVTQHAHPAFHAGPAKGRYDATTQAGAEAIARTIEHHWRQVGHRVKAWVEQAPGGAPVVRSDLVNGMPRRA